MKRLLPISTILLLLAVPVWGQDEDYPKVEVLGGFSWLEVDADGGEVEEFYGWQASISGNFHENIGLVFDVGGQYKSVLDITNQFYEFLVGPRFTLRLADGNLFAHALAGLKYARVSGLSTFPLPGLGDTLSDTAFAIGFGGGADINASVLDSLPHDASRLHSRSHFRRMELELASWHRLRLQVWLLNGRRGHTEIIEQSVSAKKVDQGSSERVYLLHGASLDDT